MAHRADMLPEAFSMEAARLHARLPAHGRAVARAVGRVREALDSHNGTWACCVSGGKDSTALVSLAVEAGWRGPLFHFVYRETPEANTELVAALGAGYGLQVDVLPVTGAWDVFDRAGGFFATPETPEQVKASAWMNRLYKREASVHQAERGWAGILTGMRQEESQRRRLMLRKKGHLYATLDRACMTCCPMTDWTSRDVWGRIAAERLPHLSRYGEGDRTSQSSRSEEIWLAMDCWAKGQGERMRRSDPMAWNELVRRFPGVAEER